MIDGNAGMRLAEARLEQRNVFLESMHIADEIM